MSTRTEYRAVINRGGYNSGIASEFAVERFGTTPHLFRGKPFKGWMVVESGFTSFDAAAARAAELRAA